MIDQGQRKPRGAVSVILVAALLVLTMISMGLLRLALLRKGDQVMAERRLQTEWLVESGLDRASAQVRAKPDYKGETWTVPATELGGRAEAVVSIVVEPSPGKPDQRAIRVEANYPKTSDHRARSSRTLTLDLKPTDNPRPDRKGDLPR